MKNLRGSANAAVYSVYSFSLLILILICRLISDKMRTSMPPIHVHPIESTSM